jgi:haloacetate dehalogenase
MSKRAQRHRFRSTAIETPGATISIEHGGAGPGLLLLHGFPETKYMWRDIAPRLADDFTVVCADLRGYGDSSTPPTTPDHAPYSKRAMADDMVHVMHELGFDHFAVAGHDRGARIAYRAALDHPDRVERLAVLDAVTIEAAWKRADDRFALAFWPWSLLAQAEPLPEELVARAPEAIIEHTLGGEWGTPSTTFDDDDRATYVDALRNPDHVHAICEEYRAAATIDREHDVADLRAQRRITCPVLVLWSAQGPLATWYTDEGGPLSLWREIADDVNGWPVEGGHFFPEEHPAATAVTLATFFGDA